MRRLHVSIEIDGKEYNVGTITGNSSQDACFCYDRDYMRQIHKPISISLPLQSEPFSERQTSNFFEGLLPEGFSRRAVADWMHADEDDYLSILSGLGQECIGALRVTEEEKSMVKPDYVKLSLSEVKALAAEGASKSTKLLVESHLSLAGASGKTGLYFDSAENQWYQPKGDAPSTHIVKQSHVRFQNIIENELLCLKTAEFMGIKTAESFLVNTGEGKEEEILFATGRYDRLVDSERVINHLKAPKRLHQEDFAQALGIPAKEKYEKEQQGYLKKMFALLRKYSSNPIEDQIMLWRRILFDVLIGNTDGHLKNFSLLYHSSLDGLRLAPAYDIISSEIYGFNKEMSLYIGGINKPGLITAENIQLAAKEAGLGQKMAMKIWEEMENNFIDSLEKAAVQLQNNGLKNVREIKKQIIEINSRRLRNANVISKDCTICTKPQRH